MKSKRAIQVVSAHAEGEVGRIIVGGVLPPPGDTLPAQRAWLERNDGLRRFLIHEPRGGVFTHYNLIVPPRDPRAAAGFIVMEPTDYPAMSGSNSICVATVLLETGMVEMREPVTRFALETPGGLVETTAECRGGVCERVTTRNVPSFVHVLDRAVEVPGTGIVRLDIAWGGAFFALVDAADLGFALVPDEARALVEAGEAIKSAVRAGTPVRHPSAPEFEGVTFVTFLGPVTRENGIKAARNATVISPGKIDRSPCGTGSSRPRGGDARAWQARAGGALPVTLAPRDGVPHGHRGYHRGRRDAGRRPRDLGTCLDHRRAYPPPRTPAIPSPKATGSPTPGTAPAGEARAHPGFVRWVRLHEEQRQAEPDRPPSCFPGRPHGSAQKKS